MLVSGIGVVGNGAGHGIPPNGVVSMGMVVGVEGTAMVLPPGQVYVDGGTVMGVPVMGVANGVA